jgi:hypothetical protein
VQKVLRVELHERPEHNRKCPWCLDRILEDEARWECAADGVACHWQCARDFGRCPSCKAEVPRSVEIAAAKEDKNPVVELGLNPDGPINTNQMASVLAEIDLFEQLTADLTGERRLNILLLLKVMLLLLLCSFVPSSIYWFLLNPTQGFLSTLIYGAGLFLAITPIILLALAPVLYFSDDSRAIEMLENLVFTEFKDSDGRPLSQRDLLTKRLLARQQGLLLPILREFSQTLGEGRISPRTKRRLRELIEIQRVLAVHSQLRQAEKKKIREN